MLKLRLIYFLLRGGWNKPMWGEGMLGDNVNSAITKFRPHMNLLPALFLKYQILKEYIQRGVTPLEFFLFDFPNRTVAEKDSFLPDQCKDKLSMKATSIELFNMELTDKYRFYLLNEKFYKRKAIEISRDSTLTEFISFVRQEKKLFIKPVGGSYGRGAFIYTYSENDVKSVYDNLRKDRFIVEALIKQAPAMGIWNESSVNTVRVPTILSSKGFHVMGCFMRTGRKGAVIDNAGGGGIFAAIDEETGIVISNGFSEEGVSYVKHPDSGIVYKGFRLPDWQSLLTLAEEVHRGMPKHKYIAYDFAYTEEGWVLVEGNWGQFISQFATGIGLKDQFIKYMNE